MDILTDQMVIGLTNLSDERLLYLSLQWYKFAAGISSLLNIDTGENLDLAWQNDTVQHKGFVPLEWLKQNYYPDQKPEAEHDSVSSTPIKEVSHQ